MVKRGVRAGCFKRKYKCNAKCRCGEHERGGCQYECGKHERYGCECGWAWWWAEQ
jgi:hypothetical protein